MNDKMENCFVTCFVQSNFLRQITVVLMKSTGEKWLEKSITNASYTLHQNLRYKDTQHLNFDIHRVLRLSYLVQVFLL